MVFFKNGEIVVDCMGSGQVIVFKVNVVEVSVCFDDVF